MDYSVDPILVEDLLFESGHAPIDRNLSARPIAAVTKVAGTAETLGHAHRVNILCR
ncbi:hypothetical protein [Rhodococcus chondri]|uniref:Uncharacterized protein n=1 Tax=Rhodococcus chondri TaxID=3065941 RepID=A0ABU7JQC2_9NOCA|nr:hypothetical protein [Rhodococcus sp. CC-R104]MEE2032224.1 hypothetical protein [Rhodococcus sp. CC-R104]